MSSETPLVHIGYHKTGTSWLQRHLFGGDSPGLRWAGKRRGEATDQLAAQHPLDFDAERSREQFQPFLRKCARSGAVPVVSLERLSGHPFSGGYDAKEIAGRLASVFPDARVLIVIREQASMLVATYKQYVKAGGPSPFERFAVEHRGDRVQVPGFSPSHFEYHRLIGLYHELFGASRVLVLPYEALAEDARAFASRIAQFAGAPLDAEALDALPVDSRPNLARRGATVGLTRRSNRLLLPGDLNPEPVLRWPSAARRVTRRIDQLERWIPDRLQRRADDRLRAAALRFTGDRYAASNQATATLTDLDLGLYDYSVTPRSAPSPESAPKRARSAPKEGKGDHKAAWNGTLKERRRYVASRQARDDTPGYAERRRVAAQFAEDHADRIAPDAGFAALDRAQTKLTQPVVDAATDATTRIGHDALAGSAEKPMAKGFLADDAFALDSPFFRFALDEAVVGPVAAYLGVLPILSYVDVWYSPHVPRAPWSSQLWHLDHADVTQVKVFVLCSDVGSESGPLTVLGARESRRLAKHVGYKGGRVEDKVVREFLGDDAGTALEGSRGSGSFVDTSRCFHYGSRVEEGAEPRQLAIFQYVTPHAFIFESSHRESAPYRTLAESDDAGWESMLLGAA